MCAAIRRSEVQKCLHPQIASSPITITFAMHAVIQNHIYHAPSLVALNGQVLRDPSRNLFCKVFPRIEAGEIRAWSFALRLRQIPFGTEHSGVRLVFTNVVNDVVFLWYTGSTAQTALCLLQGREFSGGKTDKSALSFYTCFVIFFWAPASVSSAIPVCLFRAPFVPAFYQKYMVYGAGICLQTYGSNKLHGSRRGPFKCNSQRE
jgi:hypothetical protein